MALALQMKNWMLASSSAGFKEVDHLKHFAAVISNEACVLPVSQPSYSALDGQIPSACSWLRNVCVWLTAWFFAL